jgi:superfamily I DNA and/or RNA helicase
MSRSRRSILVGDPKQLPPFFERGLLSSRSIAEFSEAELRENVFDRLLSTLPDASKVKLSHQYRMVAAIGNLVSEVFYEGGLISSKKIADVTFPMFPKAVTWLDTSMMEAAREERAGTSWRNIAEARATRKVLETLAFVASKRRKANYQVAIIAGYQAQVAALETAVSDQLAAWSGLHVKINTVDAFQGSEADVCIYSVVRTNDRGEMGFLRDWPRLNVALSRARSLLLIVGDHTFCKGLPANQPMAEVVRYIDQHPEECEVRLSNDA